MVGRIGLCHSVFAIAIAVLTSSVAWAQVPAEGSGTEEQPATDSEGSTEDTAPSASEPPTDDDRLGREGESCSRTSDCARGLRCIAQTCTTEASAGTQPPAGEPKAKAPASDSGSGDDDTGDSEAPAEGRWAGFFATLGPVFGGVTVHTEPGVGGGLSVGRRVTRLLGWTVLAAAIDLPEKGFSENDTAWVAMGGLHVGNIMFGQLLVGVLRGNERVGFTNPDTGDEVEITAQKTVFGAGLSGGIVLPFSRNFGVTIQGVAAKGLETEGVVVFGMLGATLRDVYSGER